MARECLIQAFCNPLGLYIATMGRKAGRKPARGMKAGVRPPVDLRNYRRKRSSAWLHFARSRKRLPPPRPYGEAVRRPVRKQRRSLIPCSNMGLSPRSWGLERRWESRMPPPTVSLQRERRVKRTRTQFRPAGRGEGSSPLERLRHSDREVSSDSARISVGGSLRLPDCLRTKSFAGHLDTDPLPRWQLDQPRWNDGPGHSRNGRVSRPGRQSL